MNSRTKDLVERFRVFNEEVIGFVENCSEKNWRKECAWEKWSVGVVARHIGAGHYGAIELAKKIVAGEKLPALTMEQLAQMANDHARQHADCTRSEVLELLKSNAALFTDYLSGLGDAELDRSGRLELSGGDVSAQQLIEMVIFQSGGEHLANMKAAVTV